MADSKIFTSDYERRLIVAQELLERTKNEITFLKLQIKQEKQQERWAKSSPIIRDMKARYPGICIENGAGLTYLSMDVGVCESFEPPFGWECSHRDPQNSSLGSPIVETYHLRHCPANLYVTKHVR